MADPMLIDYLNKQKEDEEKLRGGIRPDVKDYILSLKGGMESPSSFDVGVSQSTASVPTSLPPMGSFPPPEPRDNRFDIKSPYEMGTAQDVEYRDQMGLSFAPGKPEVEPVAPQPVAPMAPKPMAPKPMAPAAPATPAKDPTQEGMSPQQIALDNAATRLNEDIKRANKSDIPQLIAAAFAGLGDAMIASTGGSSKFLDTALGARSDKRKALERRGELLSGRQDAENAAVGARKSAAKKEQTEKAEADRKYQLDLAKFGLEQQKASREMGPKAPTDYRWKADGSLEPIPGSKAAQEIEESKKMAERARTSVLNKSENIVSVADKALGQTGYMTAGSTGQLMEGIPFLEQPHKNLSSTIKTLKANLAFEELQSMRAASKTGGALGQVSEKELALLESALAALDQEQSPPQLRENLTKVKTHYQNAINALQQIEDNGGDSPLKEGGGAISPPEIGSRQDGYTFIGGDPADPSSWKQG